MKGFSNIIARVRWLVRRKILLSLATCQQMAPVMSDSMERRLGLAGWMQLRLHLLVCTWCRRYFHQIRMLRRLARVKRDPLTSRGLSVDARNRITAALSDAGKHEN
ncbi:MAG: hypothetical protein ABIP75_16545 [Pyrinomonadaceae bacterium]